VPRVQVIIPYKDKGDLTLKSVESLIVQDGANLSVICVDNDSLDESIAKSLKKMASNINVLKFTEPFNYSRINNYAVGNGSKEEPYLLFMNNDVILKQGALQEMLRWIDQPHIGIVGCRLFYPDGRIQHGGVMLSPEGPAFQMNWTHIDLGLVREQASFSDHLMVVNAVTAACALMRRNDFIEIGGFDERHFPVAFSDTDLCLRLRQKRLYSFYTPYAEGVHFESDSRSRGNIEDMESSLYFTKELHPDSDLRSLVPYYL
jgi:GT2 family glycosyltransferase